MIVILFVPAPKTFAPIELSIFARSCISGSLAGLDIVVLPKAKQEAIKMVSVAPTLGYLRVMFAPHNRLCLFEI